MKGVPTEGPVAENLQLPRPRFVLLTENAFHTAYLVSRWTRRFAANPSSLGLALRDEPPAADVHRARDAFHREQHGRRRLEERTWRALRDLYPEVGATERAMIEAFGVPELAVTHDAATCYLGKDVNGDRARTWIGAMSCLEPGPYVFIFLDRILAPWWIAATGSRVINAHSAVLPHARGMFAIEQVAASRDSDHFRQAAGATVHYIDEGVDTGPIIRTEPFPDPYVFDSIWACKAYSYALAFDLLVATANGLLDVPPARPLGTPQPPSPFGAPEFKRADFTADLRGDAERNYLAMRETAGDPKPATTTQFADFPG